MRENDGRNTARTLAQSVFCSGISASLPAENRLDEQNHSFFQEKHRAAFNYGPGTELPNARQTSAISAIMKASEALTITKS
jgi:hypothetical protein